MSTESQHSYSELESLESLYSSETSRSNSTPINLMILSFFILNVCVHLDELKQVFLVYIHDTIITFCKCNEYLLLVFYRLKNLYQLHHLIFLLQFLFIFHHKQIEYETLRLMSFSFCSKFHYILPICYHIQFLKAYCPSIIKIFYVSTQLR